MSLISVTGSEAMDIVIALFADVRVDIRDGYLGTADSKLTLIETLCEAIGEDYRDTFTDITDELRERSQKAREEKV